MEQIATLDLLAAAQVASLDGADLSVTLDAVAPVTPPAAYGQDAPFVASRSLRRLTDALAAVELG